MEFNTMVTDIVIKDGQVREVVTDKDEHYTAKEVIAAIGREGADWFSHICEAHGIETQVGTVDIGVRVEVRDEIMTEMSQALSRERSFEKVRREVPVVRRSCEPS